MTGLKPSRTPPPHALRRNVGIGLMETLVAGAIGSIIIVGSIKSFQISMQSSQVLRSSITEEELKASIKRALFGWNQEGCKANFKPADYPDGTLTGEDALKGIGEISNLRIGKSSVLSAGSNFKKDLRIVKMELAGDDSKDPASASDQPVERTFVVHYKKNNLGSLSTLGGGECSAGNTAGCYFTNCVLRYSLDSSTQTVSECDLINCLGGGESVEVAGGAPCPQGQYLAGFEANGKKICRSFPICPTGDLLSLDSSGNPVCESLKCPVGQILKGIDNEGNKICQVAAQTNFVCPEGQFANGFKTDGTLNCETPPGPAPALSP